MGFTLFEKMKSGCGFRSNRKMYSCSGCCSTIRLSVSKVNQPMPSSLFFRSKRVLMAILIAEFEFRLAKYNVFCKEPSC